MPVCGNTGKAERNNVQNPFRRQPTVPGKLRVVHDSFGRVPDPFDTGHITLFDRLMSALAVILLKMLFQPQFDRRVRLGKDPVPARSLHSWNRLQEPVRTFAIPDRETLCRAIAGELGTKAWVGLTRFGQHPFRTRSNDPFATPHGNERAGLLRPDRKSCPPRTVGPFRSPHADVGPPATKSAGIAAILGSGLSMS